MEGDLYSIEAGVIRFERDFDRAQLTRSRRSDWWFGSTVFDGKCVWRGDPAVE